MMPVAKTLDPILGIDFHLILPPGGPPLLVPHPSIGIIFDPFDYIPKFGAHVFVNGLPRAQAGSMGLMLPHFPLGGTFVKPPANDLEVFMGSKTVSADNEAFSYLGMPVLACQCIGMPPIPRKKLKKPKTSLGLVLPTAFVLAIPSGVFVDGPPTISLMALGFRAGLGALGKAFQKAKGLRRWKAMSARAHKWADKLCNKLKLGDVARNRVHRATCTVTGHPVDVATGKLFTDFSDLELPGPLPLEFERVWFSTSTYRGPFGHGWHHSYDSALHVTEQVILLRTSDGRIVHFPPLAEGEEYFERTERLTLTRDASGYRVRLISGETQHYKATSRQADWLSLREVSSRSGQRISLEYNDAGHLRELVDSAGRRLHFVHDEQGRIVALLAPHPDLLDHSFEVARYAYDERGNLISMTDALGNVFHYRYEGHLLVQETDRSGLSFYFQYDGHDETARCVRTWGDGGLYDRRITYDANVTTVVDSLGNPTVYEHAAGLVTRTIDARGAVSVTRHEHGQVVEELDALGRSTRFSYDERGNPTEIAYPDGIELNLTYGELDLPIEATDALGGRWSFRYDECGQLLERVDPLGAATRVVYARGFPIELVDALGQRCAVEYDGQGNPSSILGPDGSARRFRHNALGWPIETIDATGTVRRTFDPCGNLSRLETTDGNVFDFTYDGEGNLLRAKDRHHDVHMTYRGLGRLASRTQGGTSVHFEYDTEEQLRTTVNEHGAVYRFDYGPTGEVTMERSFDGAQRLYQYDLVGRVQHVERPGGITTEFTYDESDRVAGVRHSDGTNEEYAYQRDGALLSAKNGATTVTFQYDPAGRVVREKQGDYAVDSQYGPSGMRVGTQSSLGLVQHIERDGLGHAVAVRAKTRTDASWPMATTVERPPLDPPFGFEATVARDAFGMELTRDMPGGAQSRWGRDELGRPLQHELSTPEQRLRARGYNWDVGDRLLRVIDGLAGPIQYSHDPLGQLVATTTADGHVDLRMPDAVGNLFKRNDRTDRRYDAAGQLLESVDSQGRATRYSYDPEGNLIEKRAPGGAVWRYLWGADGNLAQVIRPDDASVQFEYDALGRRIAKHYRGQQTRWVWDGDVPLHEWTEGELEPSIDAPAEARANPLVTWLFEPDSFAPLAKLTGEHGESIVTDHLGTPVAMFGTDGEISWQAELDSWGELELQSGDRRACPFRFAGQYEDEETGLYYNRFRYYDPEAGQYTSQDPIGLEGGIALYGYVSDPSCLTDPFGLSASYGRTPGTGSSARARYQAAERARRLARRTSRSAPTWRTARRQEWQAVAAAERAAQHAHARELALDPNCQRRIPRFSPTNMTRMEAGNAPWMRVRVERRGATVDINVPIELHHTYLPQRMRTPTAHQSWNLTPATPWGHARMDPFRHTGYTLVQVLVGPNRWP